MASDNELTNSQKPTEARCCFFLFAFLAVLLKSKETGLPGIDLTPAGANAR